MMILAGHSRAAALGALALLAAACGNNDEEANGGSGSGDAGQGLEGFFQPQAGESWTYRVRKELPLEVELSEEDQARRPERTDSCHAITFERTRTCNGTRAVEGAGKELTTMEIVEGGKRLGEELYDIGPEGVYFRGWLPADSASRSGLLPEGVKLVTPALEPGQSWTSTGADPERHFQFRVIERAEIAVPAGSFEAVRIQITSDHRGLGLKRTIWFAENIGIVKEDAVSYGPQRTRVRERSELVHFLVPTGNRPRNAPALVSTAAEREAAPDEDDGGAPPPDDQPGPPDDRSDDTGTAPEEESEPPTEAAPETGDES